LIAFSPEMMATVINYNITNAIGDGNETANSFLFNIRGSLEFTE